MRGFDDRSLNCQDLCRIYASHMMKEEGATYPFLRPSPLCMRALQEFCTRLMDVTSAFEGFDDGSTDAAFAAKWPLDGSGAAGADLLRHTSAMALRQLLPVKLPQAMLRSVDKGVATGFKHFSPPDI